MYKDRIIKQQAKRTVASGQLQYSNLSTAEHFAHVKKSLFYFFKFKKYCFFFLKIWGVFYMDWFGFVWYGLRRLSRPTTMQNLKLLA